MYFQIQDKITQVKLEDIDSDKITIGHIALEELEETYSYFGFAQSTVLECRNNIEQMYGFVDVYDDYHFGIISGINAEHIVTVQDKIAIYIKHNLFLIVTLEDKDNSIEVKFSDMLARLNLSKITQERIIYGFLDRLVADDYGALNEIGNQIIELEYKMGNRDAGNDFPFEITNIRKKLLLLYSFYEQLIGLGEALKGNENDMFAEEKLHYFAIFTNRVKRLSSRTEMLQNYCSNIKEAYHADLDNNMNATMETFTIVSTIFLPLSLIVGWYGMNFNMPELSWEYGYLFVIVISIIIVIISLVYFKRKKFF